MYQLVFADQKGHIFEHPRLPMLGRSGNRLVTPADDDMIPIPEGASLVLLPGCVPVGEQQGNYIPLESNPYRTKSFPVTAVAALLPQGYTRTLLPGYVRRQEGVLALFGYAAVGWRDGRFYVAAVPTDEDDLWNPGHYNTPDLEEVVRCGLEAQPRNRIIKQLSVCALDYGCFTAQNIFYRRWEGGLPVSPICNARCVGCISLQQSQCCPSPQSRIRFRPTVEEIADVAVPHLKQAEWGIVSFGQGCEGEPALAAGVIAKAISAIRAATPLGTINMNSNGGFVDGVKEIVLSGLDSIRVSLNSPDPVKYQAYYRPSYELGSVSESLRLASREGTFTSLNLLVFPGVTDEDGEIEWLIEFVRENEVKMIQLRNLNIDPDIYTALFPVPHQSTGIPAFIRMLRDKLPEVRIGSYSRPAADKAGGAASQQLS